MRKSKSLMGMTILEVMNDPDLFGPWFKPKLLRGDTWVNWRVFLAALFALGMDDEGKKIYRQFTGRTDVPEEQQNEAWLICGRRAGKSLLAAFIVTFLAVFRDYSSILQPGAHATAMVIAADRKQTRNVLDFINGFFKHIPALARLVESRTKESITLTNGVRIEVHTATFTGTRGYLVVAAVLDEIAFFATSSDAAQPDVEIVNAVRAAMITVPDSLLLGISSPYARRGLLYDAYREHFGKAGAASLVWKAATREMNPTASAVRIAAEYVRDPARASAEFGSEFRTDVEGFLTLELVESAMIHKRELPPLSGIDYRAFCDPSGGASDAFTLAIAHFEKKRVVLDVLREVVPPFSPERVVSDFCDVLKPYRCSEVVGDRYAGEWPREQFSKRGVTYKVSELTRSEIYLEFLPLLTSGVAELLDNPKLKAQLVSLERKTSRIGKDVVDHPPGGHDDQANSCAGTCVLAAVAAGGVYGWWEFEKLEAAGKLPVVASFDAMAERNRPPLSPRTCIMCEQAQTLPSGQCPNCGAFASAKPEFEIERATSRRHYLEEKEDAVFKGIFGRFAPGGKRRR